MKLKYSLISYTQSGKSRRLIYLAVILATIPFLALACNSNSSEKTQPETYDPYFPVLKEPAETIMLVGGRGKLVCDDAGYLRVNDYLMIWPYGYSKKTEGKEIWIINDKGQTVARVGDWIHFVGGEIPAWAVNLRIEQPLHEDAKGPYWLVGDVIKD